MHWIINFHAHTVIIQDSLTLLGEIVGTSVRPSAPSEQVWKALADKMLLLQKKHQTHQD